MSGHKNLRHPSTARRVGSVCALLTGLLLWPLPASGGYGWDLGIVAGYAGLAFATTLYLYPLRAEGLPHRRLFTLSQHRRLGWIALNLGLAHTALLLILQPQIGHYLRPSAPIYMLAGTLALIALAALVATGLSARKALRKSASRGAPYGGGTPAATHPTPWTLPAHAILAGALPASLGIHIIGSGQFANSPVKVTTLCLLMTLPLIWTALWRKGPRARSRLPTQLASLAATGIMLLLPLPTATSHLLQSLAPPALLPVSFPHENHTAVSCVLCHHNFIDKTGTGSCLDCHRGNRPDLTTSAEATFHTFCRNCHVQQAASTDKHGPTRACAACHRKPPQA